jgi:Mlc titration factor MtfA (ptsG expression regulator)
MFYVVFFVILGLMIYGVIKPKLRKVKPFPARWHTILLENVHYYGNLSPEKQVLFGKRIMQFLSEIRITGVQLQLEELDEILIAASAIIPVFGFEEWEYAHLDEVLLYPTTFNQRFEYNNEADERHVMGMVGDGYMNGKMILSRNALRMGFKNATDKNNTAIHEFIHLLDKEDGDVDGIPNVLLEHQYSIPWLKMMHQKMEEINKDASDIRNYAGTNQAEYFAVVSEYFFERPDLFKRKHPQLYAMMEQCFRQSPKYKAVKQ